jgi:hypothetical protein
MRPIEQAPLPGRHGCALVQIDASDAGRSDPGGLGKFIEQVIRDEADINAVQDRTEAFGHAGEPRGLVVGRAAARAARWHLTYGHRPFSSPASLGWPLGSYDEALVRYDESLAPRRGTLVDVPTRRAVALRVGHDRDDGALDGCVQ